MTRRARLWITGATTSDHSRAQHRAPVLTCRPSHPAPGRRHERQRPSRHGGMGLRSWTSWRRNCAPAAGAPTSPPRLGGWRPCSCKTRTIIPSAATSSRHSMAPLVVLVVLVQLGRADCARPRACRRGGCDHRGPPAARGRARITRPCCQKPAARATERAPIHPASRAHHARMQPGRHLVSSHPPALPPSAGLAFCQVRQTPVTPRAIRVRHRLSSQVSFPGTEAQAWQRSARLRAGRARPGTPRRRSRTAGWWCACAASGGARRTSDHATGCCAPVARTCRAGCG
jgi:hypothetical protein